MGISVDHEEIERTIRQLASARNLSPTEAIGLAVRNELARSQAEARAADMHERIREVQERIAAAPVLDPRPYRDILYNEDGLPR